MRSVKLEKTETRVRWGGRTCCEPVEVEPLDISSSPSGKFIRIMQDNGSCYLHITELEALELAFALFDTVGELKPELIKTEE